MRIIPAIDIIDGKCVRLSEGDYNRKKIYNENPLEVARMFEGHGIEYLHLVDLDGAKGKRIINHRILEAITSGTSLKVDFGGGIKSDEDVHIAFESGATQLNVGSLAVSDESKFLSWLKKFGSERIILGADARNGKIAIAGWQEESTIDVQSFISAYHDKGVRYVVCTDISKDGMLQGISHEMYKDIIVDNPDLNLIASGGVTTMDDIEIAYEIGCEGVIIGKAIYENRISLKELENFVLNAN